MRHRACLVGIVTATFLSVAATAETLSFLNITGNDPTDAAVGEAQLSVEAEPVGVGQVLFTFANAGPEASSITGVYFDDGALLENLTIIDDPPAVQFSQAGTKENGTSAKDLPGGNPVGFVATAGLVATSDPGGGAGVDPSETLGILFDLKSGMSFANVIDDLTTAALRIGVKVQRFAGGGSESFVNQPIPEPGTLLGLATFGLIGAGFLSWRRKRPLPEASGQATSLEAHGKKSP